MATPIPRPAPETAVRRDVARVNAGVKRTGESQVSRKTTI